MPVPVRHEQIALVSLHAIHDRLHFAALHKFGRQDYEFPPSGRLRTGPLVSVVIDGLLTYPPDPSWRGSRFHLRFSKLQAQNA
jgi:hypothetical protein